MAFQNAMIPIEIIEHATIKDKKACANRSICLRFFRKTLYRAITFNIKDTEARNWRDRCNCCQSSMAEMKVNERANVYVAHSISIRQKKDIVVLQIAGDALQPSTRHRVRTCISQGYRKVLLLVCSHELNMRLP